jgi:hypothetical protein
MRNAVFWWGIMFLYHDPPHQLIPSSPDYLFSPKKAFDFFNRGSLLTCIICQDCIVCIGKLAGHPTFGINHSLLRCCRECWLILLSRSRGRFHCRECWLMLQLRFMECFFIELHLRIFCFW